MTDAKEKRPGEDGQIPAGQVPAQITLFGDPILRSRAYAVREFDQDLAEEIEWMSGLMRRASGVGLAAPQVGRLKRLLVFQASDHAAPREIVNPEIEWLSAQSATAAESCLSIPGVIVEVERPLQARIRGQDRTGASLLIESSGYEARVLQHEIDHLDGVLILDRTGKAQRQGALRALRRGESYRPRGLEEAGRQESRATADLSSE